MAAWQPVFESAREIVGNDLFDLIYTDPDTRKREQVANACRDDVPTQVWVAEFEDEIAGFITFKDLVRAVGMDQLMLDIEDNENCGYFPIQVFETQSEPRSAAMITIPNIPQSDEPHDVVGWCSDEGGTACEATAVVVGDSGSGQALMIHGGDNGVRLRPSNPSSLWSLDSGDQIGEPYLLLQTSVELVFS